MEQLLFEESVKLLQFPIFRITKIYIFLSAENLSKKFGPHINQLLENFGNDFTYPGNLPAYVEEYFEEQELTKQAENPPGRIHCLPTPGPNFFIFLLQKEYVVGMSGMSN